MTESVPAPVIEAVRAERFSTLIAAGELARHAHEPNWVIFDCRFDLAKPSAGIEAFRAGHIPGARFADLEANLAGPKSGINGRHPLPDPMLFLDFLSANGVDADTQIIAYDATAGMFAARLWWLARWIGHPKVAVLDGGLPSWTASGYELSQATTAPRTRAPDALLERRATDVRSVLAADIEANLGTHARLLIDARAPERYRGEIEPLDPVAGHIPGAVNRFYQTNLQTDLRFKAPAVLRAEFEILLADYASEDVVHQCGSGVTACHNFLAMEVAGLTGSALYPGSWSEWCADPTRPVVVPGGSSP